ncbi:MAG: CDP-alcohol phosphatidyltransferase family protein [Flavobacteriales bacterium]|nr:CDP-alcohol phosphatidyltransferase family protein [Flavobacteriales bacterium]
MRFPRLPDLLTTANLACGVASILLASQGQLTWACGLVFAAAVFDVFDGLAARALGGGSPLGAQLDSLADLVSFGVAPAFAVFAHASVLSGISTGWTAYPPFSVVHEQVGASAWPVFTAAIVLVVASCWRLAKFNLDTRQTSGFLGLPTPSNGLFWVSVVLGSTGVAVHPGPGHDTLIDAAHALLGSPYALLGLALALAAIMLSELPLPSLKFKHFRWQGNQVIYLLAGLGAVLVVLYGILAVPLILVLYLLSPAWGRLFKPQATRDK